MDMQTAVYNVLMDVITITGTILLGLVSAYVKQHFSGIQVNQAKQISGIAVTFAEQVAMTMGFNGKAKYESALAKAKELSDKYGIHLSDAQWEALIESSLKELNQIWTKTNGATTNIMNADGTTVNTIVSHGDVTSSSVMTDTPIVK
jgi:hypothetical protein